MTQISPQLVLAARLDRAVGGAVYRAVAQHVPLGKLTQADLARIERVIGEATAAVGATMPAVHDWREVAAPAELPQLRRELANLVWSVLPDAAYDRLAALFRDHEQSADEQLTGDVCAAFALGYQAAQEGAVHDQAAL